MTTKLVLLCLPLSLFACFLPCNCRCETKDKNGALAKGMFVFGSSLVDNGNNNFLKTGSRLNFLPYGIDFPTGPTGRATNGKNIIDLFGEHLKLPSFIPPFYDPSTNGSKILYGVNFASAGSGIQDDTEPLTGKVTNLNDQVKNFETVTLPDLEAQTGCRGEDLLSNYLFVVATGGNDYLFNYVWKKSFTNVTVVSPKAFAKNLANSLGQKLERLYKLGGRKFVLISIYPMGCIPVFRPLGVLDTGCTQLVNRIVERFNGRLKLMARNTKTKMPGSTVVYVNTYKIIYDIITNFASEGFEDEKNPCCELGRRGCKKQGRVCHDRSTYVFFDALHPTEAVNMHIAAKAFNSKDEDEVYPININQLAKS